MDIATEYVAQQQRVVLAEMQRLEEEMFLGVRAAEPDPAELVDVMENVGDAARDLGLPAPRNPYSGFLRAPRWFANASAFAPDGAQFVRLLRATPAAHLRA